MLIKVIKNRKKGAILIEFAFAIPTLIVIMYFLLDVPTSYRLVSKLQKISELYAGMLLNINKQNRSRSITVNDLKSISKGIGMIFTGIIGNSAYPYYLSTYITCIKGTGSGNIFEKKWNIHIKNNLMDGTITNSIDHSYSTFDSNSDTFPTSGNIKNFKIQKDEIKLVVENVIWYGSTEPSRGFNSKFYILTVPALIKNGAKTFGDKHAIISPPDGLITDTAPK
jgi:hypothetical protein